MPGPAIKVHVLNLQLCAGTLPIPIENLRAEGLSGLQIAIARVIVAEKRCVWAEWPGQFLQARHNRPGDESGSECADRQLIATPLTLSSAFNTPKFESFFAGFR